MLTHTKMWPVQHIPYLLWESYCLVLREKTKSLSDHISINLATVVPHRHSKGGCLPT